MIRGNFLNFCFRDPPAMPRLIELHRMIKNLQMPNRSYAIRHRSSVQAKTAAFLHNDRLHNDIYRQSWRHYASDNENKSNNDDTGFSSHNNSNNNIARLPELMDAPLLVWPNLRCIIKNWILVNFIIKPYLDNEFSMKEFKRGSKQALEVVSHHLSNCNFRALQGLVTSDTLDIVQRNVERMTLSQRAAIAVEKNDVYYSFPYEIGIIFDDDESETVTAHKRFVEITMVFHTMKGLSELRERLDGDWTPNLRYIIQSSSLIRI